jgi:probable phosphoglycerate mutase
MELLLIRHALPNRHEPTSGLADPDLSPVGQAQADALARWSRTQDIDAIYASPMKRARQTATPMANALGHAIVLDAGLVELDKDFGFYIPYEELEADDPRAGKLRDWALGTDPERNPAEFQRTITAAVDQIVAAHRGQRVAVVCHGGVINTYLAGVLGIAQYLFFRPRYTGISRVHARADGLRSVFTINEAPHLVPDRDGPRL